MFLESPAATTDRAVLPDVLGCRSLRRTIQVRLETNTAVPRDELSGGTPILEVSRRQFMKHPGYDMLPECFFHFRLFLHPLRQRKGENHNLIG